MNVADALSRAAERLTQSGIETPDVDAEFLTAHVLGQRRSGVALERDRQLTDNEQSRLWSLVERRAQREPLAYVLGEWGFRRLTLRVDRRALVPRPETEVVVDRCLELLAEIEEPDVLDIGTGTGAIALAIADEHPGAKVTAIDASADAVALARENAAATGLAARVRFLHQDLASGFAGAYDLVVANPPYVEPGEIELLEPEVREWEPRAALVAPGLTETIVRSAPTALKGGGWVVLEVHERRAPDVAAQLGERGYRNVRITRDLAGRERVVEAQRL